MKSRGFSAEKLTTPITTYNSFSPSIKWHGNSFFCLVFKGSCLKQKHATYTSPNRINIFIAYELDTCSQDFNSDFILKDCLFGGVKLSKNVDPDKYVYNDYGIGLNSLPQFSLPDGSVGKNVIVLIMRKKDIFILGFGPRQGLDDIESEAEA